MSFLYNDHFDVFSAFLRTLPNDTDWDALTIKAAQLIRNEKRRRVCAEIFKTDDLGWVNLIEKTALMAQEKMEKLSPDLDNYRELIYKDFSLERRFRYSNIAKLIKDFTVWSHKPPKKGVYLIGDFYVGQSSMSLFQRVGKHFRIALLKDSGLFENPITFPIIRELEQGNVIPVTVLSEDPNKEGYFIESLLDRGYELVNRVVGKGL